MGSPKSRTCDADLEEGTDIWFPDGLLQNVNSSLRTYGARHNSVVLDRQPSRESLHQPKQAVVAARSLHHPGIVQSGLEGRTGIEFGRIWPVEPEVPLRRSNTIDPGSSQPRKQKGRERANSIGPTKTFHRQWRRASTAQLPSFVDSSELMGTGRQPLMGVASTTASAQPIVSGNDESSHNFGSSQPRVSSQRRFSTQSFDKVSQSLHRRQRQLLGLDTTFARRPTLPSEDPGTPMVGRINSVIDGTPVTASTPLRQGSIWHTYEQAKKRQQQLRRSKFSQIFFQYTFYLIILVFIYFVLVGRPLWKGTFGTFTSYLNTIWLLWGVPQYSSDWHFCKHYELK